MSTDEAVTLVSRFHTLTEKLKIFEDEVFESWAETVPEKIEVNLEKTLIVKIDDNIIMLNFDPELSAILREIHYLRLMKKENIPESGIEFSEKQEIYRSYILNLEKSVEWYNNVRNCIST